MVKVLTDIFSILCFERLFDEKPKDYHIQSYDIVFHLIENLILCDRLIVEENGAKQYGLAIFCGKFSDIIEYTQGPNLYPLNLAFENDINSGDENKIEKRGLAYLQIALENDFYFSPHPLRNQAIREISANKIHSANQIITYFDQRICASKAGDFANINLKVPPIIEHVFFFANKNKLTIPQSIIELRNSKNAQRFRKFCSKLDNELRELSPRKTMRIYQPLLKDIDKLCNSWKEDLKEYVNYQQRTINMSKIPILGKILDLVGKSNLTIKDPILLKKYSHFLFINDFYK